ncbi:MAG: patatin-like phospholipase family protein [Bacteroidetes bacterium]|nr:patatin-like phospholipase family protein [Bacteroidota bacterium]
MKPQALITHRQSHFLTRDYGVKRRKKIRILAIDGGGIRGIIPGAILASLEEKLREKTHNPQAKLTDYFDFIAGTSTGGILSGLYLIPDENNPEKSKYSAREALDIYMKRGGSVFKSSFWQKLKTGFGLLKNRYQAKNINEMLKMSYGEKAWLKDAAKPCLVVSYDLLQQKAYMFTRKAARENANHNFKLWEVARGTSAAPSYFSPGKMKAAGGQEYAFIDGGIIANNPALCALSEVKKMNFSRIKNWKNDTPVRSEDIVMVSIGTGSEKKENMPQSMKNKGLLGWIKPILSVRMMGCSSLAADHVERELSQGNEKQYFRIDPQLFDADSEMDNASVDNMNLLKEAGLKNAELHRELIDQIVESLTVNDHNSDFHVVNMDQLSRVKLRKAG